jgi:1-acyl-sn-glycerol-3-phosphate acyltransferase
MVKTILSPVYTFYAALVFTLVALFVAAPFVLLWPSMAGRRNASYVAMRVFMVLTFIRFRVSGYEYLPESAAIATANHCSYLDGPLLCAVLPARYGFVIRRDAIADLPVVGHFLSRLGALFVERFDTKGSMRDGNRLIQLLREEHSMGIFPEGGFNNGVSLLPFKKGAFLAATRVGVPVVPVVIRGTNDILPHDSFKMWPGTIEVDILPALATEERTSHGIAALRDTVFEQVKDLYIVSSADQT